MTIPTDMVSSVVGLEILAVVAIIKKYKSIITELIKNAPWKNIVDKH